MSPSRATPHGSAAEPIENPPWLTADPVGEALPPVATRADKLPLLAIGWQDFERLCRRLAERSGAVEKAWCYGGTGHTQFGIDILVRKADGSFEVWQSKRHQRFGASDIRSAVDLFLAHAWAEKAQRFVLALACEISDPRVIEEAERIRTELQERSIAFELLGCSEITERLRTEPEIVDDFFDRPWVRQVCPPEAEERLANRLSRFEKGSLRARLRRFYLSWISVVDPGLPIIGQDRDGRPLPAPSLTDRYVLPELSFTPLRPEQGGEDQREGPPRTRQPQTAETTAPGDGERVPGGNPPRSGASQPADRIATVDQVLASERQAIITGDAGAGKTTLLRFLALEFLSDEPVTAAVRDRYAEFIPVWVSFALWTRMAEGRDRPPSLEEAVGGFFEAQNEPELAEGLRRAIRGDKIILLVDGIDEASGVAASDAVFAGLSTFVEIRRLPVFATTRPHGLRALAANGGAWTRLRIAPLSETQREALAQLWFRILVRAEFGADATDELVATQASARAATFIAALARNPGMTRLAQTPLFLTALLKLHRDGRELPRNRFAASEEIVAQLVEHQPRRRAIGAVTTREAARNSRLRDGILDDFAYGLHSGELAGTVADGAPQQEALGRAARFIMTRSGRDNFDEAEAQAAATFSFAEEGTGLLVRKSHDNIGFLHRSLQEFLTARKLLQLPLEERIAFIRAHATESVWSEPILFLLYLVRTERDVGMLLEAIENAPAGEISGPVVRDALLTDAVFADFAHELPVVRRIAEKLFSEAELFAWGARERHLLTAVVDGLYSQSLSAQAVDKLEQWIPDYHGYARGSAIAAMAGWDDQTRTDAIPALLRVLAGENDYVWRPAAKVLGGMGSPELKQTILRLLHEPRSLDTLHAALVALGEGWGEDADVGVIAAELKGTGDLGIRLDAIRIRAARGEADLADLESFSAAVFEREHISGRDIPADLVSYFADRYPAELTRSLEDALSSGPNPSHQIALIGSLLRVNPGHPRVNSGLRGLLAQGWAVHEVFSVSGFPVDRINWSPELVAMIERRLAEDRAADYEKYNISKVLRLPFVKTRLIAEINGTEWGSFWAARGLVEGWGRDDAEVAALFRSFLTAPTRKLASVAQELPDVIDDRDACRAAMLRALADTPPRSDLLVAGIGKLRLPPDDEDAFRACYEAGPLSGGYLYDHMWRNELLKTFPSRPEIRELASQELEHRHGNLGTVARFFGSDRDICSRILKIIGPLPASARLILVGQLEPAAVSGDVALGLLDRTRGDHAGAVAGEAIIGWAEASFLDHPAGTNELDYLTANLDAVGHDYEHRRAAAVIGLGIAGELRAVVEKRQPDGRPTCFRMGELPLDDDDRYLRRILPLWDRFREAFGGDAEVLDRFELSPETCLSILNPGVPNAERVFGLLQAAIPTARHVRLYNHIGVVSRFAPASEAMRELIMPVLCPTRPEPDDYRTNADIWAGMMAAEIFAERFSTSAPLLQQVVASFRSDSRNEYAAAALAETILRRDDGELVELLTTQCQNTTYSEAAFFKISAAIASGEGVLRSLTGLLYKDPLDTTFWNCSFWVPAILRRIGQDDPLAQMLVDAAGDAPSESAHLSFLALAGKAGNGRARFKDHFFREAERVAGLPAPPYGFDLTTSQNRLTGHVLTALLA